MTLDAQAQITYLYDRTMISDTVHRFFMALDEKAWDDIPALLDDKRGTCLITGRSDSTLNRGGVRMGTADIYAAIEPFPEVADCLVLGVELPDGGYWMPLFVQLAQGQQLTDELVSRIRAAIRTTASPRHVPDEIIAVPGVPRTRTGKRLEVPLKRLFQGADPAKILTSAAVDDVGLIQHYVDLAGSKPIVAATARTGRVPSLTTRETNR